MGLAVLVVAALTFAGLRHIAPTTDESTGGHSHASVMEEKGSDEGHGGEHGGSTAEPELPAQDAPADSTSEPSTPTKDTHPAEEPGHQHGNHH